MCIRHLVQFKLTLTILLSNVEIYVFYVFITSIVCINVLLYTFNYIYYVYSISILLADLYFASGLLVSFVCISGVF